MHLRITQKQIYFHRFNTWFPMFYIAKYKRNIVRMCLTTSLKIVKESYSETMKHSKQSFFHSVKEIHLT